MDQDLRRISSEIKLPKESRERIRAQLASCPGQQEEVPMKKTIVKTRIPLIAAAIVIAMGLTLTAGAMVIQQLQFRNDKIVSSLEDIHPEPSGDEDVAASAAVTFPNKTPPCTLEEIAEDDRFKSNDWETGEMINGGIVSEYSQWDSVEVLSSDPSLRSRRVSREDGAEKMEYTAEDPASLVDTLTGRVTFDLSWMGENYDYVPDANFSFVVTDPKGNYVCELLSALYAKPDRSGYVRLEIENLAQADYFADDTYVIEGSYETAYYYTSKDGMEFIVKMDSGKLWVSCHTSHARINLYGAYLTKDEVEDILDNLSFSIQE